MRSPHELEVFPMLPRSFRPAVLTQLGSADKLDGVLVWSTP